MKRPMKAKPFEKSGFDKDRGLKEGSKADNALDKKQSLAMKLKGKRV